MKRSRKPTAKAQAYEEDINSRKRKRTTDAKLCQESKKLKENEPPQSEEANNCPDEPVSIPLKSEELALFAKSEDPYSIENVDCDESLHVGRPIIPSPPNSTHIDTDEPCSVNRKLVYTSGPRGKITASMRDIPVNPDVPNSSAEISKESVPISSTPNGKKSPRPSFEQILESEDHDEVNRAIDEKMESFNGDGSVNDIKFSQMPYTMRMKVIHEYLISKKYTNRRWPYQGISKNKKSEIRKMASAYALDGDGILLYKKKKREGGVETGVKPVRVLMYEDEILEAIQRAHFGVLNGNTIQAQTQQGHVGKNNVRKALVDLVYFDRMTERISKHVDQCHKCQVNADKSKLKRDQKLHPVAVPQSFWYQIGIDLMGPMKKVDGYEYIMTVVCYFTKWVEIVPLKSKSAAEVTRALFSLFCRHGCPAVTITDQGTEFCNVVSTQLYDLTGVSHRVTSAYHPQANGLVERANRTTLAALLKCLDNIEDWVDVLEVLSMCFKARVHSSTNKSPFEMVYNRPMVLPLSMWANNGMPAPLITEDIELAKQADVFPNLSVGKQAWCKQRKAELDHLTVEAVKPLFLRGVELQKKMHNYTAKEIRKAQIKYKRDFEEKHRRGDAIVVGDKVLWRNMKNLARAGGKMDAKRTGPYWVRAMNNKGGCRLENCETGNRVRKTVPLAQLDLYKWDKDGDAPVVQVARDQLNNVVAPRSKLVDHLEKPYMISCYNESDDEVEENNPPVQEGKEVVACEADKVQVDADDHIAEVHGSEEAVACEADKVQVEADDHIAEVHESEEAEEEAVECKDLNSSANSNTSALNLYIEPSSELNPPAGAFTKEIPVSKATAHINEFIDEDSRESQESNPQDSRYGMAPLRDRLSKQGLLAPSPAFVPPSPASSSFMEYSAMSAVPTLPSLLSAVSPVKSDKSLPTVQHEEKSAQDQSLLFCGEVSGEPIQFRPLSLLERLTLSQKIVGCKMKTDRDGILFQHQYYGEDNWCTHEDPVQFVVCHGDGNCFFRAISAAITGSQVDHLKFRQAIVQYIMMHGTYEGRDGHEYLQESKMSEPAVWATENEIAACAEYLRTDIYVYYKYGEKGLKWLKFSGSLSSDQGAIYLSNKSRIHFDLVTGIKD